MEHRIKKQLKKQKLKLRWETKVHIDMPKPEIQYRIVQQTSNVAPRDLVPSSNDVIRLQDPLSSRKFIASTYVVRTDCVHPDTNCYHKSVTLQRNLRHSR